MILFSFLHVGASRVVHCGMAGLVLMVIASAVPSACAANKFWNGGTGNWNTSSNWDPAGVPVNGDDLFFPSLGAGAFKLTTNNIPTPARRFRSINFTDGGYTVRGNAVVVSNGVASVSGVGVNTVDINLTLGANQTFANSSPTFTISGDVDLNGFNLTLDASDAGEFLVLLGVVSGTGNLTKPGAGFLNLSGATTNTYVGNLSVTAGELRLAKIDGATGVTGDLLLSAGTTARWFNSDQVADSGDVVVGQGGSLILGTHSETLGPLDLTGATVSSTTGTLTMNGDLTNRASSVSTTISGNLSIGNVSRTFGVAAGVAADELLIPATISGGSRLIGFPVGILVYAGISKTGDGRLVLSGTNTYGGGFAANDGFTRVEADGAFGFVPVLGIGGGVTVNAGAQLTLSAVDIAAHRLTVNQPAPSAALSASGVSSWSGPVTLNTNAVFTTGGTLAISNAISGVGGLTLGVSSAVAVYRFAGTNANDFDGDVLLRAGTLELAKVPGGSGNLAVPNDLTIGNPGDSGSAKTVRYLSGAQMDGNVTINCAGVLDLNNRDDAIRNVTMSGGTITTGTGTLSINGNLTVQAELSPCDNNTISGNVAFLFGPRFIAMPVGSILIGAPDLIINAVVSSSTELAITGNSGRVFLNGANTFTGLMRLDSTSNDLIVRLNNPAALGGIAAGTILNGVQLELGGFNFAAEPITNVNAGSLVRTIGNNLHAGPIVLNADLLITNTAAITELAGAIIGPGDLRKTGTGTLRFSGAGANTFGTMFVNQGLFEMDKNAGVTAANPLVIGDGVNTATARNFQGSQTDGVTVNRNSLWDLNGNNDTITPLVLDSGGDVTTGVGVLSFGASGSITVTGGLFGLFDSASSISGNLNLGSSGTRTISVVERASFLLGSDPTELIISAVVSGAAGFNKTGAGDMSLTAANTFTGNATVSDGELLISHDTALGTTAGSTSLTGDALLGISGDIAVAGESLTLNTTGQTADGAVQNTGGTNTWTGPISLAQTAVINVETNTALIVTGVMNGNGGVTKIGPGRLEYAGTQINTYTGTTTVNEGSLVLSRTGGDGRSIPATLVVGDGVGGNNADLVDIIGTEAQLNNLAAVTVNSSGLLRLSIPGGEVIGSLAGSGRVQLNGTGLFTGGNNTSTIFDGVIAGTGGLTKNGSGTMTLNGFNTYSGATTVAAGTLLVNGGTDSSTVTVSATATLGGTGGVGALNVNNLGNVAPGTSPGSLRSRNTVLSPGSNFRVEINGGTVGVSYDQLNVDGTISLNGAQLLVTKSPGFAPADGQQFVILDNDLADAVVGSFGGLLEGALLTAGGTSFRISYVGGTGNDITLTVTNIPARFASARVEAGNGNGRIDPNECDHLFIALENRSGSALNITGAQLDCLTPGVAVTQHDSDYPTIAALGFGTNTTPFQIRVAPNFLCGQNIDFNLVVSAAGFANFSVPFTLNSGGAGAFTTFNSTNIPKAIIDLGETNSLIIVNSGFRIGRVRVSLHATHPAAGDLRLRLVSPDGTEVLLSANRGGNTPNYGNSCAARTTFDDDAATKITAATAPFAGTFAPEGNLSAFIGELSTGTWRLFAEDTVPGDTGVLQCWSLFLAPATCSDGGGECESCLASVAGELDGASPTLAGRMTRNGVTSGCGNAKDCPGINFGANPFRYRIHEFTNNGPATCVTVMLNVPCADPTNQLHSSAYLTSFNPSDICANYLGDAGTSVAGGSLGYSFQVGAGAKFVVVVNEINQSGPNQGCGNYTLDLYGLPCPPPVLDIARTDTANRVRLSWSTAYPGYVLRARNNLNNIPPQNFITGDFGLPEPLRVIDGRYVLTNTVPGSLRFYELVK